MLTYRIQMCGNEWILRHPDYTLPVIQHADKEYLITLLPDHFKKRKEKAFVDVLDDWGRFERRLELPTTQTSPL